eukprot:scaffold24847_cov58-Phaeocystis_antarctica.AAC.5
MLHSQTHHRKVALPIPQTRYVARRACRALDCRRRVTRRLAAHLATKGRLEVPRAVDHERHLLCRQPVGAQEVGVLLAGLRVPWGRDHGLDGVRQHGVPVRAVEDDLVVIRAVAVPRQELPHVGRPPRVAIAPTVLGAVFDCRVTPRVGLPCHAAGHARRAHSWGLAGFTACAAVATVATKHTSELRPDYYAPASRVSTGLALVHHGRGDPVAQEAAHHVGCRAHSPGAFGILHLIYAVNDHPEVLGTLAHRRG